MMAIAKQYAGMRKVPGGTFMMGSEDFYADERPVRAVAVDQFWIDETPITNAQFSRFVATTGYVTFAEIAPDPRDYPGMDPESARAGSIVFMPPDGPVELSEDTPWWSFVPGADWRHPRGPGSTINGLGRHPVVHVALDDALAYAAWAGKALPSEAEWEFAARGGIDGTPYAWGDEFMPGGKRMAKTWEGTFPWRNTAPPHMKFTSPVRTFPPNRYGIYDMIGNVWEWTADHYAASAAETGAKCCGTASPINRTTTRHVLKGGSHMCAPEYCQRYRPAARWPQPLDTTTSHVGFRCIRR